VPTIGDRSCAAGSARAVDLGQGEIYEHRQRRRQERQVSRAPRRRCGCRAPVPSTLLCVVWDGAGSLRPHRWVATSLHECPRWSRPMERCRGPGAQQREGVGVRASSRADGAGIRWGSGPPTELRR
jgi:hypothetical protein